MTGAALCGARMAELCCERARLSDGQAILELGCGWGSMALFMAQRYPRSSITAVSNSRTQKALIDERAKQRGLTNLVRLLCRFFQAVLVCIFNTGRSPSACMMHASLGAGPCSRQQA